MNTDKLKDLLSTMDLPKNRKTKLSLENLRWLQRNIFIRNGDNPNLKEAQNIINKLINK